MITHWRTSHTWKAVVVAVCAATAPASADVDLNGPWRLQAATAPYFNPDVSCIVDVVQLGTSLTVTGNDCSLPINLTGTIDPPSGAFSVSGVSNPFCATLTVSGSGTPTSDAFSGTFECDGIILVTGPFSGSLCANGELDPAEDCDDGNLNTTDCCAPTCEFEPEDQFCFGGHDLNCNETRCDGAGTCLADPGPAGVRCDSDFNGCTDDLCDAAGECTHPDLPAGTTCELDFNVCTDDTCDGAGECLAAPNTALCDDYNACTIGDQCAAGSCIPGGSFAASGTDCNTDADLCTIDQCDGAGGCQNVDCSSCCGGPSCVEQVSLGCATPEEPSAKLQLSRRHGDPESDRLTFKWEGPTDLAAFGDPTGATDYELCLYQLGGPPLPRLRYQGRAAAGGTCGEKACWRSTASGFSFKDPELDPDGLFLLKLRSGGKITAKGRGPNIGWDRLDFLAPPMTMQLKASNGMCWSATWDTFTSHKHNRLKAIGGQ